MSVAKTKAVKLLETAKKLGWDVNATSPDGILRITKHFTAGSMEEFVECDMEYYEILSLLPSTEPGSVWGTDGGGIGALGAIKSGVFQMSKSGGSKRVLSAISKLKGAYA
mgnify:CR=1 FL=1|jgi:hypothetical protein|tara:strand:+ start:88 stop:417 length:330 start_codon:yes stop_codon:yes gene_type:complete